MNDTSADKNKLPNVTLINLSDCKILNGNIVVKRKYGKFTRPVFHFHSSNL